LYMGPYATARRADIALVELRGNGVVAGTRLNKVWQLLQLAAANSLPGPSGNSWLQVGSPEQSRAAVKTMQ
jgi:hypothetical protein